MPVKSLMELATMACIKNIRELNSVGDFLPYENVRQILLRVDNAQQLRQIELNSPQIEGETGEIWLKLIEREFPMEYKAKAYKPSNPKKWYRVWEKYKKDHDQALEDSERKLMSALAGLKQDREKNTSRITDRKLDRKLLPLTPGFGVAKRGWAGPRDHRVSAISFNRGTRTKTNTGASVMRKVRREVKEIANIHGSLSRPSQKSGSAMTHPAKAPVSMVNDYRRAAQPVFRPTPKSELSSAVEEYEERATYLSDSEDDDGGRDDLFDEDDDDDERPPARSSTSKSFAKSSATSLLKKRPGAASSSSPTKTQAQRPAPKRSGLLSNSYKPSAAKSHVVSSTPSSSSKPAPSSEPPRPTHHLPRTQSSPPPASIPGPSSPPPPTPSAAGPPRKRKAVDIFMKRKKRA